MAAAPHQQQMQMQMGYIRGQQGGAQPQTRKAAIAAAYSQSLPALVTSPPPDVAAPKASLFTRRYTTMPSGVGVKFVAVLRVEFDLDEGALATAFSAVTVPYVSKERLSLSGRPLELPSSSPPSNQGFRLDPPERGF